MVACFLMKSLDPFDSNNVGRFNNLAVSLAENGALPAPPSP